MYSWHHFLSAGIPMSHSDLDCDPNMVLIVGDSRVRSLCFQTQYQQSFVPMAKLEKVIELADLKLLNCPNAKFLFLIGLHCDFSHLEPWKEDRECSIMVTSHPDTDALLDKISAATFRWQNCYSELVVIWTLPYTPDFYVFNSMQVQQSKCKNALSVAQMNDFARDYNSLCSAIVSGWKTKMSHPPFQMVTLCPQTGLKQDNRLPFEGCTVDGLHPHPKTCQDFWPQLFRFAIAFKKSHSQGKYHWLDSPHKTFDEANSCIELSVSQSNQSSGLKIPTLISGFSRTNKMKPSTKPNKLVPVNQRELQKICNSSTAVTEKKVMFPIKSETDIPPKLHPKAYSKLNSEIPNELLEIDLPDIEVVLGSVSVNTGSVETDKQGVKIDSLSKQVDVQKSESVKIETVQNDECNSQLMKEGKVPLLKVIASQVIEKCGQPVSKVLLKISGGLQSKETKGDETYSVPKPNKKSMLELPEDAEPYVESEYEAREEISNTNKEIDPESKGQVIDGHTAKKTVYSSTSNLNNSESQPQSKANPLEEYYETLSPVGEMPLKELETEEVMSEENDFDFVENSSISSLSDWEFMENCSNSDQVTGVASCPPTVTECMEIKSRTSTLVMQKPGAPSKTLPINKNKDYPATTRSSTHSLLPNESYERKLLSNSSVEGLRQKNLFPQDAGHESRFCGVSGSISVEVGSAGFRPRLSGSQSPPILSLVRTQSKEKVFKSRSRDKISFFSLSPQRSLSPFSPPLRLKSPFHFSRRSRSPLPYSRKSRSPLPYSRRSRSPLPYSRRSRSPLPYSRRSRSPLPYSRRSRSPLPYSRRSRSPLPYSRRSRSPLLFSRRSRSPLPYSRKSQSPLSFSQRSSFLQRSPVASRVRRSSRSSSVSRQKPFHRLKSRSPSKSQSRSEMKKSTNSKHLRSERSSKHSEATPRRTVRSSSKERLKSRFLSKESKSRISKKSKKSRSISTERSKSPFAILSKGNSTSSFLQKRKKSRSRSRCRYENHPRSRTSSSKSQISSRSRAKEISRPQPDTINRSPVNPKTHDRCSDFENRILKRVKKSKTPLRSSDSKSTRRFPPENSRKGSEGISLPSLSKDKKTKGEEQKLEKEEGKMPIDCKEIIDDASLRTCLGNELYEKFCQEKQQRFVQLEEEFEVYKTMPDLYPDYEKIYESFVTNFMTQSLRHSEEEEERLWMKFWHLQFYHIKQRCWEQRLAQLMQDFRQKADEKRGAKEGPTLITKSNEVDKTLDILSSMVPDFGVLGPSVSSIIAAVKERGPTSNEAYRLLADPDNALLLELALKKLSPGQRALAEEHTMRLLKQATEAVKESGLNLEAIAQASLGKDPVYILNLIKTAVKVEGLETSDKLINEFFLRVCELHFEMAMHSDEQK